MQKVMHVGNKFAVVQFHFITGLHATHHLRRTLGCPGQAIVVAVNHKFATCCGARGNAHIAAKQTIGFIDIQGHGERRFRVHGGVPVERRLLHRHPYG